MGKEARKGNEDAQIRNEKYFLSPGGSVQCYYALSTAFDTIDHNIVFI